jgi:hypothetical protein
VTAPSFTGTASNAANLGGQPFSNYARTDVPASIQGPLTVTVPGGLGGTLEVGTQRGSSAGIYGSNSGGNLHLDSGPGKLYLNYNSGTSVVFGLNTATVDSAGNVTANSVTSSFLVTSGAESISVAGTYCGQTGPVDGNIKGTDSNNGYRRAKLYCQTNCANPTAHMCSPSEMVRSQQLGISTGASTMWVATGTYGVIGNSTANDCNGWTNTAGSGVSWSIYQPSATQCNIALSVACCR